MKRANSPGVGLGGDGDEIDAIRRVEACFGVQLDPGDAPTWRTAGDLYRTLRKALPPDAAEDTEIWNRFVQALTQDTGADPRSIEPDSLLLGTVAGARMTAFITAIVAVAIVVGAFILLR